MTEATLSRDRVSSSNLSILARGFIEFKGVANIVTSFMYEYVGSGGIVFYGIANVMSFLYKEIITRVSRVWRGITRNSKV